MILKSKNFFSLVVGVLLCGACSMDPRLDDLKIQIKASDMTNTSEDGDRGRGILYNRHCCSVNVRSATHSPISSRSITTKAVRKQAARFIGEFTADFPSTFSVGSVVTINLNCFNVTALSMDFTQELTDEQCVAYAATGDLLFTQTVEVPADRNLDFRITY